MLELINRAREDPVAEASRLGIDLNDRLPPATLQPGPRQPLAPQTTLNEVAAAHSRDMITRRFFSHVNPDGAAPWTRAAEAGYFQFGVSENIAARTQSFSLADDTRLSHEQLFLSPGHRTNLLDDDPDVGLGIETGPFDYDSVRGFPSIVTTQLFGIGDPQYRAVTGVAFADSVTDDNFYNVGEGRAGIVVAAIAQDGTRYATVTGPSGGYALRLTAGDYRVTATSVDGAVDVELGAISLSVQNIKIDIRTEQFSSPAIVLSGSDQLLSLSDPELDWGGRCRADIRGSGANTLILDAARIDLVCTGSHLHVISNEDDRIVFEPGWSFVAADLESGNLVRRFRHGDALMDLIGPRDFTNPLDPFDVNASGGVSALDALNVINESAIRQFSVAATGEVRNGSQVDLDRFQFLDVSGDGRITSLDAIRVINEMARRRLVSAGGEQTVVEPNDGPLAAAVSVPKRPSQPTGMAMPAVDQWTATAHLNPLTGATDPPRPATMTPPSESRLPAARWASNAAAVPVPENHRATTLTLDQADVDLAFCQQNWPF
jgi:hypothetical protein